MADLNSQWEFSTWFSQASVFLPTRLHWIDRNDDSQADERREDNLYPAQGIKSFSSNENVIQRVVRPWSLLKLSTIDYISPRLGL